MVKYILLGIVQGITEFFPVSSSGHLVIVQNILGMKGQELVLSVVLHLGTGLAVVIFFFKDILSALRKIKLLSLIFIVTTITAGMGFIGKDFFEDLFSSPRKVSVALIVTGIILISTRRFMGTKRKGLNIKDALILGFMQGLAIIPGISRSGITISTLLFRGLDKEISFNFSFLVSIPVIFGAALLESKKIDFALQANLPNFLAGFVFSLLSGLLALRLLKAILHKAKFHYFGYYCIFIAIITLLCK